MKKSIKIALTVILVITAVVALVACNSDGEISIDKSPQVTYVLGQELNLKDGTLRIEGKTDVIPMDSSDVKVTGYDKNTLGKQELTVSYKKMTTTLTVTVVNRFEPNRGVTTDYFVGEQFDEKGFFTLTRDNGTSFSVSANATGLAVTNFNTQTAGVKTVTLSYQGFSGGYDITVHEIASTELYLPKTNYKSHESLNVDNGYIILKNAGGNVTRQVPVTADMVTGFDTSVVTAENAVTPYSQTITVHYLGLNIPHTIKITYSNVTLIHERYQELVEWVENGGDITDELAEGLFEATQLYLGLSVADKAYVSEDELQTVVQIAAVYGSNQWYKEYASVSNALQFDSFGNLVFVGSYSDTVSAYEYLVAPDCALIAIGGALIEIYDEFASVPLMSSTVGIYLANIVNLADFDEVIDKMDFMFTLYDKISLLPSDLTFQDVDTYADQLKDIASTIGLSSFAQPSDRQMYKVAADWHMDNLYDLLYQYYLDDADTLQNLMAKQLPGKLENLYMEISNALTELDYVNYAVLLGEEGYVVESTMFMLYYRNANNLASQIRNGNDLYQQVYNLISFVSPFTGRQVSFNGLVRQLDVYGYQMVMTSLVGNKAAEAFWNDYLDMVVAYMEGGSTYLDSNEFGTDITALLDKFLSMTPSQQLGIIQSLYPAYDYMFPEYGLEISYGGYSFFTGFLNSYYGRNLSDDGYRFFAYYMYALECYVNSNGDYYGDYFDMFEDVMESQSLNSIYNFVLHGEGREKELALVQNLHDTLDAIYKYHHKSEPDIIDEQMQGYFDALANAINQVLDADVLLEADQDVFSLLIASFEQAQYCADRIVNSGNQIALDAFYNRKMFEYNGEYWTFDYALNFARNYYIYFIYYNTYTYSEYYNSDVPAFMQKVEQLMWNGWYSLISNVNERVELSRQVVADIMTAYRALSAEDRYMFWYIDMDRALYGRGLADYFSVALADIDGIKDLVDELRLLEINYMFYEMYPDEENGEGTTNREAVSNALQSLEEKLNSALYADYQNNEDYQLLLTMYNYYKQAFEASQNVGD